MVLPLSHIRVIDLSRMLPGPYCSMILSDLGAEVIQLSVPRDPYGYPPPYFQKGRYRESAFNAILMRNKKSISLNLKKEPSKEIFYRLVKTADVVLETFRPKVTKKLKIDYETLSKVNPSIIYCSLTGYGQYGPYEQIAGHDMNYIGLCGILNLNRPRYGDAEPVVPGVQAADIGGGLMAVIGILGALLERNNNVDRKGQYIDISMLDTVFSFMPMAAALHFSRDLNDGIKSKNILHGDFPYYAIYRTRDNKFLSLGAIELKFWHDFCDRLGRKDLITKQTVTGEEKEHVFQEVQMELMKKNQAEWMEIFKGSDACVMPIKTFAEACQDPQIVARKMITTMKHPVFGNIENVSSPIKYSKTPLSIRSLAPKMGEHTEEILFSLDYTDEEIKNFKKRGII